jgi:tRNA A37 methylthiotransferase MiaB
MIGQRHEILMEKGGKGHTACFAPVQFAGPRGSIIPVRITGITDHHLLGSLA